MSNKREIAQERTIAKQEMKKMISDYLIENFGNFSDSMNKLKKLSPKSFCDIYVQLLNYNLPKIRSVQFDMSETDNPATTLLQNLASYEPKRSS